VHLPRVIVKVHSRFNERDEQNYLPLVPSFFFFVITFLLLSSESSFASSGFKASRTIMNFSHATTGNRSCLLSRPTCSTRWISRNQQYSRKEVRLNRRRDRARGSAFELTSESLVCSFARYNKGDRHLLMPSVLVLS